MKMKIFNRGSKFTSSKFFTILFAAFFTVLATSCLDDEPVPEPDPVGYVSVYHVSPAAESLSIFINNNRINSNPFKYTDYTGYLRFYTGKSDFKFTPYNASNTLLENEITVAEDSIYSLFVTGTSDDLQLLVVNDKISFNDAQNSMFRVLHASPDAPEIRLVLLGSEELTFEDLAYRDISNFEEISSGSASFEIRNAETDELISTVSNYDFNSGNFYTVMVRGFADPQDENENELNIQVVRNFFNR